MYWLQYMGTIEDTKKALIASGLHDSKVLHVDKFTYKNTDYHTAVEDSVGKCGHATHQASAAHVATTLRLCIMLMGRD